MKGIYGRSHFELEQFIDMSMFDNIQLDIWKGIATAYPLAAHGYLADNMPFTSEDLSGELKFKILMQAYPEYLTLPDTNPIKIAGNEIESKHGYNALSKFLKYAYSAHDLLAHYSLWDYYPGWSTSTDKKLTNIAFHFTTLIQWIDTLVQTGIFLNIGRAYLITIDSNGHSFEHRDPPLDPDNTTSSPPEFIHFRPNVSRPFYVYDPVTKQKHYIATRAGWWNDSDTHGGEVIMEPSYAVRVDGIFTDTFRNQIKGTV